MKKPRVEDFDPTAPPPLGSPFEGMPEIQSSSKTETSLKLPFSALVVPLENSTSKQPPVTTSLETPSSPFPSTPEPTHPSLYPYARTSVRPYGDTSARRTITRYAFEFFQDQIERLRSFSIEEKLRGEPGSMSEMVREALDMYIAKRKRTEE